MLFCAFVCTAWAGPTDLPEITKDLENPIYYTIMNTRSSQPGGLMYYAGENVGLKDGWTFKGAALEDKYKFFFTGSHDALYVHNAATGLKLASMDSWTEDGKVWAVGVSPKGGGLAFGPEGGLNGNECWNEKNYQTNETTSDFTTWSANDDGSIFLCTKVSEFDILATDKFYVIEAPLFNKVQGVQKGLYVNGDAPAWGTIDLTDKAYYWIATVNPENGQVAFKNAKTQTYLNGTGMSEEAAYGTIKYLGDDQWNIVVNGTTVHANNHGGGSNAGGNIVSWGSGLNTASAWTFIEKADPDAAVEVEVIYNFAYNGVVRSEVTQTVTTLVGEEYPNITTLPYGVAASKPEGVIANSDVVDGKVTKTIEVTNNLPFVPANSYAEITDWYYLKIKGESYLSHVANQSYIDLNKKTVELNAKDAYTWAFVGNPFDGYKIVNRAAGAEMVLSSTTTITDDANTFPVLTSLPVVEGNNELWMLTASAHQENGFYIAQKGHDANRMNNRGNKLAYWTGGADNGSTFTVEWRDVTGAKDLQALVDACLANSVPAGVVGGYTQESYDAVAAAIVTAQEELAKDVKDVAAIAAATATLQNAIAALTVQLPNPESFYKIKNAYSGAYMGAANGAGIVGVATDFAGLGQIFQFEAADGGNFYLKNVERGAYLNSAKAHAHGQNTLGAKEEAVAVSINSFGMETRVAIRPEGGAELHHDTNTNQVVGWNTGSADSQSAWVVIEVADLEGYTHTVSVTDAGWATLYLGYNAEIPEGVTAYAVSSVDAESATLEEVKNVLPANTAVLLNAAEGNYNFDFTAETAEVANNVLRGTVFNTAIAEDIYVLGNGTAGVGFYKAMKNMNVDTSDDIVEGEGEEAVTTPVNDAVLNNAFKAYLPANGVAAQALRFNFGGTTAIESVVNGINANAAIYDLSGRRVEKATKGIYIVNGKKMIVK